MMLSDSQYAKSMVLQFSREGYILGRIIKPLVIYDSQFIQFIVVLFPEQENSPECKDRLTCAKVYYKNLLERISNIMKLHLCTNRSLWAEKRERMSKNN